MVLYLHFYALSYLRCVQFNFLQFDYFINFKFILNSNPSTFHNKLFHYCFQGSLMKGHKITSKFFIYLQPQFGIEEQSLLIIKCILKSLVKSQFYLVKKKTRQFTLIKHIVIYAVCFLINILVNILASSY